MKALVLEPERRAVFFFLLGLGEDVDREGVLVELLAEFMVGGRRIFIDVLWYELKPQVLM